MIDGAGRRTALAEGVVAGTGRQCQGPAAPLFWDTRLYSLLDYWNAKRGRRAAPMRGDLDPCDIPQLLPALNLLEVSGEPPRFRHRLVGTELVTTLGRDVTGRYVDSVLYGPATAEVIETLSQVPRTVRPHRRRARLDWHPCNWLTMESLELPLLDEQGRVAMILRGSSFRLGRPLIGARLAYDPLPS